MVKSWKDFGWKLADNVASLKLEVLIFASWALAVSLITSVEWMAIAGIVLSGRVITDLRNRVPDGDTQV